MAIQIEAVEGFIPHMDGPYSTLDFSKIKDHPFKSFLNPCRNQTAVRKLVFNL